MRDKYDTNSISKIMEALRRATDGDYSSVLEADGDDEDLVTRPTRSTTCSSSSIYAQANVIGWIAMSHSLNLKVIAEGVEREDQLEVLRELGCDEIQGFLFSRPMSADACEDYLKYRK